MWRDLRLLIESAVVLRRVKAQLNRIADLRELVADLDNWASASTTDDGSSAANLVRATDRAVRLLGPAKDACVPRSLTLLVLWSKRGRPADFVSGVHRHLGDLRGHAWLEAPDLEGRLGGGVRGEDAPAEIYRYANHWTVAHPTGS